MSKTLGIVLIVIGVVLNNVVYLQDLWFGQSAISLDGPRAIIGLVVSIIIILVGSAALYKKAN